MGFFDKLKFWKHEDEFDFDKAAAEHEMEHKKNEEEMGLSHDDLGLEKSPFHEENTPEENKLPSFHERTYTSEEAQTTARSHKNYQRNVPPPPVSKDIELISSKLDTLKAMLASIEQRLNNIEKAVGIEKKENLW